MGYQSIVVIALTKKTLKNNYTLASEIFKDCDEFFIDEENEIVSFKWEWVKWYDSYTVIQKTKNFLNSLEEEDYAFLRIGEEEGDIERKGSPSEFGIYTTTDISMRSSHEGTEYKEIFKPNSIKFIEDA